MTDIKLQNPGSFAFNDIQPGDGVDLFLIPVPGTEWPTDPHKIPVVLCSRMELSYSLNFRLTYSSLLLLFVFLCATILRGE